MHLFPHSTGENRMISLQAGYQDAIRKAQIASGVAPTYTYTPLASSGGGISKTPTTFTSRGQTVNSYDTILPTSPDRNLFAGSSNYSTKIDPTAIENMGPSAGQSWSGGTVRSDGAMAGGSNVNPYRTIEQQAQDYADSMVKPPEDPALSRDFNAEAIAKEQAKQTFYAKQQADAQANALAQEKGRKDVLSSIAPTGNSATDFASGRLTQRLSSITDSRQAYIERRRAEGASDMMIRVELAKGAVATPQAQGGQTSEGTQKAPPAGWDQVTYDNFKKANPTLEPDAQDTAMMQNAGKTPTKGGASGSTTGQPLPTPYTPEQQTILNTMQGIMNDPAQDPITKIIAQQYISEIQSGKENLDMIAKGANVQADVFAKMRTDITDTTDKVAGNLNKSYALVNETAKSIRDERDKSINAAQQAQQQRLQWDADNQTRKINDAKRLAHDEAVASLAVTGRMGSSGAISILEGVNKQYDQQLQDLQNELGVQKTELSAKFTGLHSQASQDYFTAISGNIKDFTTALSSLEMQGLSGRQSVASAENSALQTFVTNTVNARQAISKSLMDGIKEMQTIQNAARDDKRAVQNDAYKNVIDSFTKFPAGSSERRSAIDMYKKSGGTINFDANTRTIEEINKAADNSSGNFIADNVGKFRDAKTNADLAVVISSVVSGKGIATADERTARRNDLMALLQGGEATRDEFNQLLMNTAYIALDPSERQQVDAKTQVAEAIGRVKDNISKLTPAQQAKMGFWAKKLKGVANMADVANDPEFIQMMSNITYPMASLRKELFGSALTTSELAFSDVFLANPMKEDINDSLVKLDAIGTNITNDVSSLYSHRLGSKELYDVLKKGGVVPTSSPSIKDWNKVIEDATNGNTSTGGVLQPMKLPETEVSSVLQQAGFKGKALQIAMAVSRGESVGWNANAVGDTSLQNEKWGPSVGLFQIRTLKNGKDPWRDESKLYDPLYNAKAAYAISKGGTDWSPWSVYKSGSYKEHMKKLSQDYSSIS